MLGQSLPRAAPNARVVPVPQGQGEPGEAAPFGAFLTS